MTARDLFFKKILLFLFIKEYWIKILSSTTVLYIKIKTFILNCNNISHDYYITKRKTAWKCSWFVYLFSNSYNKKKPAHKKNIFTQYSVDPTAHYSHCFHCLIKHSTQPPPIRTIFECVCYVSNDIIRISLHLKCIKYSDHLLSLRYFEECR